MQKPENTSVKRLLTNSIKQDTEYKKILEDDT